MFRSSETLWQRVSGCQRIKIRCDKMLHSSGTLCINLIVCFLFKQEEIPFDFKYDIINKEIGSIKIL